MRHKKREMVKRDRKGIYVLPNMFTSASLFGGFYAIIAAIQGRFVAASTAILISCVFDLLDGKVARFTGTESDFGKEYDSLSDLVAFGVAPGVLAFQWALEPLGRLGWLACFTYVICGALRLARFNIQKEIVAPNRFKGLPIPAAAGSIASLILFTDAIGWIPESPHIFVFALVYVLSFLMVSTIDYASFKELELKKQKPFSVLVGTILICIVITYRPKILLFLMLASYLVSGPIQALFRHRRVETAIKKKETDEPAAGNQVAFDENHRR